MELKIKQGRIAILVLALVYVVSGDNAVKNDTKEADLGRSLLDRKSRGIAPYMGMISCAMKYDVRCFVDAAEDYLEVERTELLAEADAQAALQSTGRSSSEDKPSDIANTLSRLISELTSMFQNGISGFFKQGKDLDDEDEEGEESDEEDNNQLVTPTNDSVGETREITQKKKKKKKKNLKGLIRLAKPALVALIIMLKFSILLKVLQTAMQFKFLMISLGGFAIQAAKMWISLKNQNKEHGHHEEIVYKNPYGAGNDEFSSPGGGPYGGEYNAARSAQALVYSMQKPLQ